MKYLFLILLYSCSQLPPRDKSGQVNGSVALDHIRSSYLLGCVEAFKELKVPKSFEFCRDKAKLHQLEVEEIIYQD